MTAILNVVKEDEVSVKPLLGMYRFHHQVISECVIH